MAANNRVDYRETIVTFMNSESTEHAANSLGITKASLIYRLNTMRKAGVNVPKAKPQKVLGALMVAQLNSLINRHTKS